MESWKSIERAVLEDPIWVIKYTFYQRTIDGITSWCEKGDQGAEAFTSCHGYYGDEADAYKVLNHFPKPNTYRVEKVWRRKLK